MQFLLVCKFLPHFSYLTPMPAQDIDFEKELWNAANELRGAASSICLCIKKLMLVELSPVLKISY